MATNQPITLHQGNDETILISITPVDPTEDLTTVTSLTTVIKPDACTADASPTALVLTTADPTEMVIVSQTAVLITARAFVPAASLSEPYGRVWRVDAYVGVLHRTAIYGDVTVIDL